MSDEQSASQDRLVSPIVRIASFEPSDADLKAIQTVAPAAVAREDVFAFPGVISTDALDSYFTRMDVQTTLKRFTADFKAGTSLQAAHNVYRLEDTLGKSYKATLEEVPADERRADETHRVLVGWYMPREDDAAVPVGMAQRGIRLGTLDKMSVGFGGPDMRIICDEDGSDLWDWDSKFYPGMKLKDRVITYTVVDANALEGSLVYKNATPGSEIPRSIKERIQALADERHIPAGEVHRLGAIWGCRFAAPARRYYAGGGRREGGAMARVVADFLARKGAKFSKATREKIQEYAGKSGEVAEGLVELLEDVIDEVEGKQDNAARGLLDSIPQERRTPEGVRALLAEAEQGRQYATALVDRAVKAKTAIKGDAFKADDYRARLERWAGAGDLAAVEEEVAEWEGRKAQAFRSDRIVTLPGYAGDGPETDEGEPAAAGATTIRSPFDEVPG